MHTVGFPRQRGPRPRHIKRPARAEPRGAGGLPAGGLPAGLPRARRVPRLPAAAGVPAAVVVRQIIFLPGRPSPREHRLDDQIKDLFLAEVTRAVIIRPGAAASRGGTARANAGPAAAAVTRRAAVPGTPGS